MPAVTIKDHENFEVAMRRFKRMIDKTNRISDIRSLKHFEKPTTRRKRKRLAAVKRQQRKVRLQRQLFKNTRGR